MVYVIIMSRRQSQDLREIEQGGHKGGNLLLQQGNNRIRACACKMRILGAMAFFCLFSATAIEGAFVNSILFSPALSWLCKQLRHPPLDPVADIGAKCQANAPFVGIMKQEMQTMDEINRMHQMERQNLLLQQRTERQNQRDSQSQEMLQHLQVLRKNQKLQEHMQLRPKTSAAEDGSNTREVDDFLGIACNPPTQGVLRVLYGVELQVTACNLQSQVTVVGCRRANRAARADRTAMRAIRARNAWAGRRLVA